MHQWNILYGKRIVAGKLVFPCYTSKTTIALWQLSSGQVWQVVGCIPCSSSKVEELFFPFENRNKDCSLEFQDKEISQDCKVCFEYLSVVSICLFIFFLSCWILQPVSLKDMDSWQSGLLLEQPLLQCLVPCLFFLWFIPSVQTPPHLTYCCTDSGCGYVSSYTW